MGENFLATPETADPDTVVGTSSFGLLWNIIDDLVLER